MEARRVYLAIIVSSNYRTLAWHATRFGVVPELFSTGMPKGKGMGFRDQSLDEAHGANCGCFRYRARHSRSIFAFPIGGPPKSYPPKWRR
jgi:hypothetical protein